MSHSLDITGDNVTVVYDGVDVATVVASGRVDAANWADEILAALDAQQVDSLALDSLGFDEPPHAVTRAVIGLCRQALRDAARDG